MFFPRAILLVASALCLPSLSLNEVVKGSIQCAQTKNAKAETYLESTGTLIDKLRNDLPLGSEVAAECSCPPRPVDCEEVLQCGRNRSGVYRVWPRNRVLFGPVSVFCDMETGPGGWTVIQRRGSDQRPTDFFSKPWYKYKSGFGDPRGDFWLGNNNIYALTNQRKYYLRIDLMDFDNQTSYAFYDQFWIDNEEQNYKLHVADYGGNAGDALSVHHSGHPFSTFDRDNDNSTEDCSRTHGGGGWWFASCLTSNLNGLFQADGGHSTSGVVWSTWRGAAGSMRRTEMKVRPLEEGMLEMDIDAE